MNIQGFNKLTLLDYPGHTAATVFFGGCNWCCPFCQNSALVLNGGRPMPALDENQILAYLASRSGILEGVCVTGGEALLEPQLESFLMRVKEMAYKIKLDTNGSNPTKLKQLYAKGLLDYVALDIKNDPIHYPETIGVEKFDLTPVRETLAWLQENPLSYECRTTVVREFHDAIRLRALARWILPTKRYFLQQFEDNGSLIQAGLTPYTKEEMITLKNAVKTIIPTVELRGVH